MVIKLNEEAALSTYMVKFMSLITDYNTIKGMFSHILAMLD